jgi:hypothetical protein
VGLFHLGLVERPQVRDRVVDRVVDLGGHRGSFELVRTHAQGVRRHLDPVEPPECVCHGGVATVADVVDQLADRAPQRRVEDVVDASAHQCVPGIDVHVVPDLSDA